jgi:hypothetical protein
MTVKLKLKGENIFNVQIIILHHFAFVAQFITIQKGRFYLTSIIETSSHSTTD